MIIGEALKRLNQAAPQAAAQITDQRRVMAFRNILVHGYDVVDDAIVWDVVRVDLPRLLREVTALLVPD